MNEEYNPFQSPALVDPRHAPSTLGSGGLYMGRPIAPFASGHVRATFTMTLLALVAVSDLFGTYSYVAQNELLDSIKHGARPALAMGEANDQLIGAIAIGNKIACLVTMIAFLMWCHRVYRNLPALGARRLESTPGWAVGWYFVPIASFFKPFQTMAETWQHSDPAQIGEVRKTTSPIVVLWWAGFIITILVDRFVAISLNTSNEHPTIDGYIDTTNMAMAACLVEFVAVLLAIVLVFWVDKNQQTTHNVLSIQQSQPTAQAYIH